MQDCKYNATVLNNSKVATDVYKLDFAVENFALLGFKTGQFAHIRIPDSDSMLLRRPFSVHSVDVINNAASVVYAVVGRGTRRLSKVRRGDELNILFPLGNGFEIESCTNKIWLVGGGIGCAPLLSAKDIYPACEFKAFLGFRSKEYIFSNEFALRYDTTIATDDGSFGIKGYITDILKSALANDVPDMIFACGPESFFYALKQTVQNLPVKTQVSLERRMGCGTGGCAVCVCKINGKNQRICLEGPVFDLSEVDCIG